MSKFDKYIDYIINTRTVPLPAKYFDDDWEPIGPIVRKEMIEAGIIRETPSGILLGKARGKNEHR